jgi:protease-4
MSTEVTQPPAPEPKPLPPAPPSSPPTLAPAQPRQPGSPNKTVRRVIFWSLLLGLPLVFFFVLMAGVGSLLSGTPGTIVEKDYSKRLWTSGRHKIAIVHLDGTIMSGDGFIKKQIDRVISDSSVKGVVFRVNSPGGLVTASDHIYQQLLKMRDECASRGADKGSSGAKLPMVVSMGGMAASGGYYVSMAVGDTPEAIYAEPTTWTGSIGVIIPHYNAAKFLNEHGIVEDSVASHRLKGMGSFAKEMTPEIKAIFQGLVDESYADFRKIVKAGRPKLTDEQITTLATGQVYTCKQGLANGLVDKQGYLEDAIRGVIEMAGLSEGQVHVVEYERQPTLLDLLMAKSESKSETAAVMELAKPQAYFLAPGWLPVELEHNKK